MKKLKNAKIKSVKGVYQVADGNGQVFFSGKKIKKFRICEGLPWVWILGDPAGDNQVFIENSDNNTVWFGPKNVAEAKASENNLLFMRGGKWYAQYFGQQEAFMLGDPVNLKGAAGAQNVLFIKEMADNVTFLYVAYERQIRCWRIKNYEKLCFNDDAGVLKVSREKDGEILLFDNEGRYIPRRYGYTLEYVVNEAGLVQVLKYCNKLRCYCLLYQGHVLLKYKPDELHQDNRGEKTLFKKPEIENFNDWYCCKAFIVPENKQATKGTLYQIKGRQAVKAAEGNLFFVNEVTLRDEEFPKIIEKVKVGEQIFDI